MKAWVWTMVVVGACDPQRPRETAPPPHQACQPVVHQTTGPLTKTYYEQYRFVGGSSDGKRVAVVNGKIGPGAGVPVLALSVLEAGTSEVPYYKPYFVQDGTADEMPSLMERLGSEHADELASAGVTLAHDTPSAVAWCADAAGKIHSADGQTFELQVTHAACAKDASKRALEWKLCLANGGACITHTPTTCFDGSASFLDLYKAGRHTWAVLDVVGEGMKDVTIHGAAIAGAAL